MDKSDRMNTVELRFSREYRRSVIGLSRARAVCTFNSVRSGRVCASTNEIKLGC